MKLLRSDLDPTEVNPRNLTSDCKYVERANGRVDLVKEISSVRVFDYYWDQGIRILRIWHAGGTRNPKFQEPDI
jgi:hypothetical protein